MREITLQAALLVPTTFLKATERIFLSSIVSSYSPYFENYETYSTISSNLSHYSANLAKYKFSSRLYWFEFDITKF
jgi:hypothetical protein